ncbi:EcsC family protein [Lottiidibacillus patelloidae]|nr:EcsC family protein [Lottiidibacillus patelloidae]
MKITRDEQLMNEIKDWEMELLNYFPNDFEQYYEKWISAAFRKIDKAKREAFLSKIDTYLFHLHAFIENSQSLHEKKLYYIRKARTFDTNVRELSDIRSLPIDQIIYMAEQDVAKQRLLSLVQGGLTGYGGGFTIADLPFTFILNLRAIQNVSISYGYDINIPSELMISLKVFHASIMPKRMKGEAWNRLWKEVSKVEEDAFFYEGEENFSNINTVTVGALQFLKLLFIRSCRSKDNIPFLSIALGAGINYKFTKEITEFAQKFYQKRLLFERK